MREAHRLKAYEGLTRMTQHGPVWTGEVRLVPEKLTEPIHWKRPRNIFVNSMSDLFHPSVPDGFITAVWWIMGSSFFLHGLRHRYQILTKRAERLPVWLDRWTHDRAKLWLEMKQITGWPTQFDFMDGPKYWPVALPNIWLGISAEDQPTADKRIPVLLQTPAAVRWISAEPLLGPIDFNHIEHAESGAAVDWVVVGGESGPRARPMHPAWARSIRDQCQAAGVPFFFKQWGEWAPGYNVGDDPHPKGTTCHALPNGTLTDMNWNGGAGPHLRGSQPLARVGKKAAGAMLDGREWREYPNA
jgi:protein gp37